MRTAADKAVVNEVPVHGEALFKLLCALCWRCKTSTSIENWEAHTFYATVRGLSIITIGEWFICVKKRSQLCHANSFLLPLTWLLRYTFLLGSDGCCVQLYEGNLHLLLNIKLEQVIIIFFPHPPAHQRKRNSNFLDTFNWQIFSRLWPTSSFGFKIC